MKISDSFEIKKVMNEVVLVPVGTLDMSLGRIISLNESAALLYESLKGKSFSLEDAAAILTDTYDVEKNVALADASELLENLKKAGVVEL